MNKRIKELTEQAGIAVWGDAVYMYHPSETLDSTVMTKFAELIVRECMQVCKKTEQYEVGNQDPVEVGCIRAGAVFCREDIKEHFGVEE